MSAVEPLRKLVKVVPECKGRLLLLLALGDVLSGAVPCLRLREKVMAISFERFQMTDFQSAAGTAPARGLAIR